MGICLIEVRIWTSSLGTWRFVVAPLEYDNSSNQYKYILFPIKNIISSYSNVTVIQGHALGQEHMKRTLFELSN